MPRPRKAHLAHTVRRAPRDITVAARVERAYPDLASLGGGGVLDHARKLAKLLFAAGAAAGLAAGAAGCQPPECAPTRLGEIEAHTPTALDALSDFRLKDAADQVGIGIGVVPHPVSYPLAGAMPVVYPPPPPVGPETGDGGTVGTVDGGTPDVDAGAPGATETS